MALFHFGQFLLLLSLSATTLAAQPAQMEFHGDSWAGLGRVEHSTGNWHPSWPSQTMSLPEAGMDLRVVPRLGDNWQGAIGFGVERLLNWRYFGSGVYSTPRWTPFISEAQATYSRSFSEGNGFSLTLGYFPYEYNPDAKDLGFYLLKGYVYPQILTADYKDRIINFANTTGAMASYHFRGAKNDLLLMAETEDKPLYDLSVADVFTYRILPGLEVGAGVNLYRLIPWNPRLTSPGSDCHPTDLSPDFNSYPSPTEGRACYILSEDTVVSARDTLLRTDTTFGSFSGTKLMARFHFDPKSLFGFSGLGPWAFGEEDLVLYGEAAILGLKDYPVFYDDIWRRMPVMLGFDLPCFGLLETLSLEIEYWATVNSSDNMYAEAGSWLPAIDPPANPWNHARDRWKWSLNAARKIGNNARLTGLIANNHLRLEGDRDLPTAIETLSQNGAGWFWSRKKPDWLWTLRLDFLF